MRRRTVTIKKLGEFGEGDGEWQWPATTRAAKATRVHVKFRHLWRWLRWGVVPVPIAVDVPIEWETRVTPGPLAWVEDRGTYRATWAGKPMPLAGLAWSTAPEHARLKVEAVKRIKAAVLEHVPDMILAGFQHAVWHRLLAQFANAGLPDVTALTAEGRRAFSAAVLAHDTKYSAATAAAANSYFHFLADYKAEVEPVTDDPDALLKKVELVSGLKADGFMRPGEGFWGIRDFGTPELQALVDAHLDQQHAAHAELRAGAGATRFGTGATVAAHLADRHSIRNLDLDLG